MEKENVRLLPLHQKCNRCSEMEDSCETNGESKNVICLYTKESQSRVASEYSSDPYCEHMDRRSRLCNLILEEPCPTCKLASQSYYYENIDKPEVKSRYMDFYYKQQMEKMKQTDNHCSNDSLGDHKPPSSETAQAYFNGDPSPTHQATVPRNPFETKSRYLDYLKYLPHGDDTNKHKKEPIKTSQMDWKDYHRLNTIHKFMDDLQYNYPALCTTGVIGTSLENRNLKVMKVSNSNCGNTSVWIDAGIHAREWIAPAVNTYLANYIVKNFNELPDYMTSKDWYFLPVMNPDGYEYSHTNYRMWRKNKAYQGNECIGVDLNRNFSYGWGGKGSSDDPRSPFYRGPHPFSEPESRAVRDMLKWSGINFQVYVTLHSFGEVILFPYAYRDELCPDYIRLLEGATAMSKAIHKTSGTTYKVGISRDVMYGAAGTSCDWSYGDAKIPYCYLLELRSKKHKFRVPQMEIEQTGQEIVSCITALMEFVDNYDAETCKSRGKTSDVDLDNIVELSPSDVE